MQVIRRILVVQEIDIANHVRRPGAVVQVAELPDRFPAVDLDDPTKVIGQMEKPLIVPAESERNGYVPNVVYTCGALIHNDTVIIPYAMSDSATSFATVTLADLLSHLTN